MTKARKIIDEKPSKWPSITNSPPFYMFNLKKDGLLPFPIFEFTLYAPWKGKNDINSHKKWENKSIEGGNFRLNIRDSPK